MKPTGYKVVGYANRLYQFEESFGDIYSAVKFLYEKFRLLNIQHALVHSNMGPYFDRHAARLYLKRLWFISKVPDFICLLKITGPGEINEELVKSIIKELLS